MCRQTLPNLSYAGSNISWMKPTHMRPDMLQQLRDALGMCIGSHGRIAITGIKAMKDLSLTYLHAKNGL